MKHIILIFILLSFVVSLLPLVNHTHWVFRICTFAKVQVFVFQLLLIPLLIYAVDLSSPSFSIGLALLLSCVSYHCYQLAKYTGVYRHYFLKEKETKKEVIGLKIMSVNVYQYNTEYFQLVESILINDPDIVFAVETDKGWCDILKKELKNKFEYTIEAPLSNTYGMILFSKNRMTQQQIHYYVADDLPSIETLIFLNELERIRFFGVHPPPPSPTEEETSKERDGELMSVAKRVRLSKEKTIVCGDFNTVSWSRESKLFEKVSGLLDARLGRGLLATYHANYWFFRFPIDLFYHSSEILISDIKRLPKIKSDHFPVLCSVEIPLGTYSSFNEEIDEFTISLVDKIIEEGKKENSDRE